MLNLEPKHEKKSRLERFFGDLLGAEKTIPRLVSVPENDLAFMD